METTKDKKKERLLLFFLFSTSYTPLSILYLIKKIKKINEKICFLESKFCGLENKLLEINKVLISIQHIQNEHLKILNDLNTKIHTVELTLYCLVGFCFLTFALNACALDINKNSDKFIQLLADKSLPKTLNLDKINVEHYTTVSEYKVIDLFKLIFPYFGL